MFKQRNLCFLLYSSLVVFFSSFSLAMHEFKIGNLNSNRAGNDIKRAAFFKLIELKKTDVILIQ